jgi:very-short-patch-repair endonuclease
VSSISPLLAELARVNDGVITAADASAVGITRRQLLTAARRGELRRLFPGVWAHRAVEPSERQLLRAVLAASGGVASHRSAGHLHGLLLRAPGQPEVSVDPNRNFRPEGVVVYRHDRLEAIDIEILGGQRITTPVRTIIDLGTRVTFATLKRAVERGLRNGQFNHDDLEQGRRRLARRGRNGVGPVGLILEMARPDLVATASELELRLWEVIDRHDLPTPLRQFEVLVGGERFFLDVAYPRQRIAIEGDGFGVHTERAAFEKDRARQNALVLDGWLILRFTWQQLLHQPEWVASTIRRALSARSQWPALPAS